MRYGEEATSWSDVCALYEGKVKQKRCLVVLMRDLVFGPRAGMVFFAFGRVAPFLSFVVF